MRQFSNRGGFGRGGLRIGPGSLSPFIKVMIIANLAIFILQQIMPELSRAAGLIPSLFFSDFPNKLFQPFTYMFLHGGFGHILFNMFALWMFGTEIEHTWGSRAFGKFYLLGGLAGALLTLIVYPGQPYPTIGASAAIYAVLIAYWLMFPNRQLYIYFIIPVKVKYAIPGLMIIGFLFGGTNVAHMAHLGGALFGLAYFKADWKLAFLRNRIKNLRQERNEAKLNKNREQAEQTMKRVDAILDKINEVGMDGLSAEERRFLQDASSELSRKNQNK
ncbi:MAG: rhomboid family intramembrane serine protease [bacterium]|nr:rhomboid family intramembrane serine protease [bacterium]